MKIAFFLIFAFAPLFANACGGDEIPVQTKIDYSESSGEGVNEVLIKVPAYYDNKKFSHASFKNENGSLNIYFSDEELTGLKVALLMGNRSFFSASKVTLFYKPLGRFNPDSGSFSYPLCFFTQELAIKT